MFAPFNRAPVNAPAAPPAAPAMITAPMVVPEPSVTTETAMPTIDAVIDFQFLLNQLYPEGSIRERGLFIRVSS